MKKQVFPMLGYMTMRQKEHRRQLLNVFALGVACGATLGGSLVALVVMRALQ